MSGTVIGILVVLGVGLGLFVLLGLIFAAIYNSLVRLRNQVKNAWAQIDVQLKRRHDLIPNLVETVRGYATHESQTLERVIEARRQAVGASSVEDRIKAEAELGGALGRLMLVVEQYPDLKANQNFMALQEELTSTENKIAFARQFYNDAVMHYNTKTEVFPTNVVAAFFHFVPATPFEAGQEERKAPQVKF
ncbi:MAG TPA: LemA family protein [Planctomycetota bacterium]|jgi:LemA protein|nr:LemA family protein [Planctomycetota bacterium]